MRALLVVLLVLAASPGFAATDAFDRANDLAYFDGFQDGDNGGSGWDGGWVFFGSGDSAGLTLDTSTNNGDGDTDGDGDIDTANVAWEIFAQAGDSARVSRHFDGELAIGQVFSVNLDAVAHPDPYAAGVELTDAFATCVDFRWNGDDEQFEVVDAGGFFVFPLQTTDEGIHVEYELTGTDSYTLRVNPLGGTVVHRDGLRDETCFPDGAIFFVESDAGANLRRLFFNRIRVPEPGSAAAGAATLAALIACGARREPA
jgi:hypothetical protein